MTGDGTAAILTVDNVTKSFGGLRAVDGCTLAVAEGSITGLIGPNGAGKTTLFNVISGLTPADGGQISLGTDRLDGLPAHAIARRGVGRTFQIPRPLGRMTVLENVLVYAHDQPGERLARVFTTPRRVTAEESRVRERAQAILHGLSLRVDDGELVAVIGPNGAGKSTLLKTLAGLLRPRSGRIALRGADITGAGTQRIVASGLCYVPQEANVFPSLSVWENLTIGGWTAPRALNERARAVMELFPVLAERRRARAGTLSGGERQMLAMAMALMVEPRLLLLDEPSAGLAPALQRLVFDRVREINARGLGILLVEQNARESLALCQRAYVLAMGRVRAEGPGGELRDDPEIRRLCLGG